MVRMRIYEKSTEVFTFLLKIISPYLSFRVSFFLYMVGAKPGIEVGYLLCFKKYIVFLKKHSYSLILIFYSLTLLLTPAIMMLSTRKYNMETIS